MASKAEVLVNATKITNSIDEILAKGKHRISDSDEVIKEKLATRPDFAAEDKFSWDEGTIQEVYINKISDPNVKIQFGDQTMRAIDRINNIMWDSNIVYNGTKKEYMRSMHDLFSQLNAAKEQYFTEQLSRLDQDVRAAQKQGTLGDFKWDQAAVTDEIIQRHEAHGREEAADKVRQWSPSKEQIYNQYIINLQTYKMDTWREQILKEDPHFNFSALSIDENTTWDVKAFKYKEAYGDLLKDKEKQAKIINKIKEEDENYSFDWLTKVDEVTGEPKVKASVQRQNEWLLKDLTDITRYKKIIQEYQDQGVIHNPKFDVSDRSVQGQFQAYVQEIARQNDLQYDIGPSLKAMSHADFNATIAGLQKDPEHGQTLAKKYLRALDMVDAHAYQPKGSTTWYRRGIEEDTQRYKEDVLNPRSEAEYEQLKQDITERFGENSYDFQYLMEKYPDQPHIRKKILEKAAGTEEHSLRWYKDELLANDPNYEFDPDSTYRSQWKYLQKKLKRNEEYEKLGKSLNELSFEDFNELMANSEKDAFKKNLRALDLADTPAFKETYTIDGQKATKWYRSITDAERYRIDNPEAPIPNENEVLNFLPPKADLEALSQKEGKEWSESYSNLSLEERIDYGQRYGNPVQAIKDKDELLYIKDADNTAWLNEEQQQLYENTTKQEQKAQQRQESRQTDKETIKNLRSMYKEQEVQNFEAQPRKHYDSILDALDEVEAEKAAQQGGNAAVDDLTTLRAKIAQEKLKKEIEPSAADQANDIVGNMLEYKTIGERSANAIERKATNSVLFADTARSYTFGYRQKALLGMMGTAGAMSLLEATMNAPSAEIIERRRQLEEERRRKQMGY